MEAKEKVMPKGVMRKWIRVSEEELQRIQLYWQAGFAEQYIANLFNRDRGYIRRLMESRGLPSIRAIQHQRAKEWLDAQTRERSSREARGQEDPR